MATLHQWVESNGWRKITYTKISSEKVFQGFVRDSDIDWLFYNGQSGLHLIKSEPVSKNEQPCFFPESPEILLEEPIQTGQGPLLKLGGRDE